jgi:two-component system, NarL family, response regulator NreC
MINVFVTDDQELYLEGLVLLLNKQPDIRVVGSALSGQELLDRISSAEADILLLDVNLPDFGEEELIVQLRQVKPNLKVIYLTMMRGTRYVHKLNKHSIQGYLLKSVSINELCTALHTVASGGTYFSKETNISDTGEDFRNTISIDSKKVSEILSKREIEILTLICKEFSNAEIANKLFLSVSTVETHRKNLISKLGVNNTVGLVKYALKNRLIE